MSGVTLQDVTVVFPEITGRSMERPSMCDLGLDPYWLTREISRLDYIEHVSCYEGEGLRPQVADTLICMHLGAATIASLAETCNPRRLIVIEPVGTAEKNVLERLMGIDYGILVSHETEGVDNWWWLLHQKRIRQLPAACDVRPNDLHSTFSGFLVINAVLNYQASGFDKRAQQNNYLD